MNLQPSTSILYNVRRELFADELNSGGHGQIYLSGAGTFTPTTTAYVFYRVDFLSTSVVNSVVFRDVNDAGNELYKVDRPTFAGITFPANATWNAPLTSITLDSGTGIAYQYKKFIPEDELFT